MSIPRQHWILYLEARAPQSLRTTNVRTKSRALDSKATLLVASSLDIVRTLCSKPQGQEKLLLTLLLRHE